MSMRIKQLLVTMSATKNMNKNISSAFGSKTRWTGILADRFKQKNYVQKYWVGDKVIFEIKAKFIL